MSVISVQNLWRSFGEEEILKGISREFAAGQIHGIVGNNGSGKTVLMKCICGFLRPTHGRVLVNGKEVGKDMDFPADLGIIIETPGFLPHLTGVKNLRLLAGLKGKITEREIRDTIRRVGLDPALKKPVSKYSLGMRQRLGIAQAIMEDPALLILDEPFNGLDKTGVRQMRRLLKDLRSEGKTILLASHNQGDIDQLCDTVCEMDGGHMSMVRTAKPAAAPEGETALSGPPEDAGPKLTEELTLLENAALPLLARGMSRRQAQAAAATLLREKGLGPVLHARPSMVSARQRRAVFGVQAVLEGEKENETDS